MRLDWYQLVILTVVTKNFFIGCQILILTSYKSFQNLNFVKYIVQKFIKIIKLSFKNCKNSLGLSTLLPFSATYSLATILFGSLTILKVEKKNYIGHNKIHIKKNIGKFKPCREVFFCIFKLCLTLLYYFFKWNLMLNPV